MTIGDAIKSAAETNRFMVPAMDKLSNDVETCIDVLNIDASILKPVDLESLGAVAKDAADSYLTASQSARRLADQLDRMHRILWAHSPKP